MRFLGMAGYYRKFCNNFSVIAEPLTNLLSKKMRFKWISDCQNVWRDGVVKGRSLLGWKILIEF